MQNLTKYGINALQPTLGFPQNLYASILGSNNVSRHIPHALPPQNQPWNYFLDQNPWSAVPCLNPPTRTKLTCLYPYLLTPQVRPGKVNAITACSLATTKIFAPAPIVCVPFVGKKAMRPGPVTNQCCLRGNSSILLSLKVIWVSHYSHLTDQKWQWFSSQKLGKCRMSAMN